MTAAAHPDLKIPIASEAHRRRDIGRTHAAGDDRRSPVDHRVPDLPCLVVAILIRQQDLSRESAAVGRQVWTIAKCGYSIFHEVLLASRLSTSIMYEYGGGEYGRRMRQ